MANREVAVYGLQPSSQGPLCVSCWYGERVGELAHRLGAVHLLARSADPSTYSSQPLSRFHASGLLLSVPANPSLRLQLLADCRTVGSLALPGAPPLALYALAAGPAAQVVAGFAAVRVLRNWHREHPAATLGTLLGSSPEEASAVGEWEEGELLTLASYEEAARKQPAFLDLLEQAEQDCFRHLGYPNMVDVVVLLQEVVFLRALAERTLAGTGRLPPDFAPCHALLLQHVKQAMGLEQAGHTDALEAAAWLGSPPSTFHLATALYAFQCAGLRYPAVGAVSMYRRFNRMTYFRHRVGLACQTCSCMPWLLPLAPCAPPPCMLLCRQPTPALWCWWLAPTPDPPCAPLCQPCRAG